MLQQRPDKCKFTCWKTDELNGISGEDLYSRKLQTIPLIEFNWHLLVYYYMYIYWLYRIIRIFNILWHQHFINKIWKKKYEMKHWKLMVKQTCKARANWSTCKVSCLLLTHTRTHTHTLLSPALHISDDEHGAITLLLSLPFPPPHMHACTHIWWYTHMKHLVAPLTFRETH